MGVVEGSEAGKGALGEVFLPSRGAGVAEVDSAAEGTNCMHTTATIF